MSRPYISKELRRKIANQSLHRCGYCLSSELLIGSEMDVDHIIPKSLGGPTEEANLWLSCSKCNEHKSKKIQAVDPLTAEVVRLFNPRQQKWSDHFQWSEEGAVIVGKTSVGRATVQALQLNRPLLVSSRQVWRGANLHPPES